MSKQESGYSLTSELTETDVITPPEQGGAA
jgi:hypothetical protein